MTKNSVQKNTSKKLFVTLAVICSVLVATGAGFLYTRTLGAANPEDYVHVLESNTVDYKVYMKPGNGIINRPYLGMNDVYTYDIVDHVELNNTYTSKLSQGTDVKYDHFATASLIIRAAKSGVSSDSDPIITDEVIETFWQHSSDEPNGDTVLTEHVDISLDRFRDRYMEVKSSLDFNVSGAIRIDFNVDAVSGDALHGNYKRSITIPISDPYFEIKIDGEDKKESDFNAPARTANEVFLLVTIGALMIGALIAMLTFIKKALSYKSWYRQEIDSLLNDYDDAIIATSSHIHPKLYTEHIETESFKEMLKLATDTGDPILYYETRQAAYFYIPKDKILYFYLIEKTIERSEGAKAEREIEDEQERRSARRASRKTD